MTLLPEPFPARLQPEEVPLGTALCPRCHERPIKLAGLDVWLCIACYALEQQHGPRPATQSRSYLPANFATPECLACGSREVDADGRLWWCTSCRLCTRVRGEGQ
ncbi:hypothetical protein ACIHFE_09340 [Streptomyces sp. NPDC052396]|uniref:hypothetical protein n=1 Tax=Streptomyces sp. NPDC052396 TaxID=3365689 RepID=UPI0037CDC762